jgi:hypothetical protein
MSRIAEAFSPDYGYPNTAGFKEKGSTSQEAAARVDADNLRGAALIAIRANPSTADEVASALGLSVLTIRPRLSELRALGKIVPNGERRKNASGASAAVWRAVSP